MAYQPKNVIVYTTSWCGDGLRTMRFLDLHEIKYEMVDIDQDEDAEELVLRVNRGMRSVPTVALDDHYLTEPSNRELREAFGIA